MPFTNISDLVSFASNVGVMVQKGALEAAPEQVHEAIKKAYSYLNEPHLLNACRDKFGKHLGVVTFSGQTVGGQQKPLVRRIGLAAPA